MTQEPVPFDAEPPAKQRDVSAGMIVALVIVVLAGIFIFQNTVTSSVRFLWLDAPTWVWFVMLFLVGVAVGWLAHLLRVRRATKTEN